MPAFHVTIPAIAIVVADTPEEAERYVADQLDRAGFYPFEDHRVAFESDTDDPDILFRPV